MKGRFNVAFSDLNELAYPVLRHRMKMNFEAIAERVSPDDVITMIIAEVAKKFGISVKKDTGDKIIETHSSSAAAEETSAPEEEAAAQDGEQAAEDKPAEKKKRRFFGKK